MKKKTLDDIQFFSHKDKIGDDIFHYSAKLPGYPGTGFGTDHQEDLAFKKAINELVERSVFHQNGKSLGKKSTNGFAAHNDQNLCEKSALMELIERDAFLTCWLGKRSPQWFDARTSLSDWTNPFIQAGFQVRYGCLAQLDGVYVIVGCLSSSGGMDWPGVVFSSSANSDVTAGVRSVYYELRRAATAILNNIENLPQLEPNLLVSTSADHFRKYAFEIKQEEIEWVFEKSPEPLNIRNFNYDYYKFPHSFELPWEVAVGVAVSSEIQEYYVGETDLLKVNMKRYSGYFPDQDINFKIHPLP